MPGSRVWRGRTAGSRPGRRVGTVRSAHRCPSLPPRRTLAVGAGRGGGGHDGDRGHRVDGRLLALRPVPHVRQGGQARRSCGQGRFRRHHRVRTHRPAGCPRLRSAPGRGRGTAGARRAAHRGPDGGVGPDVQPGAPQRSIGPVGLPSVRPGPRRRPARVLVHGDRPDLAGGGNPDDGHGRAHPTLDPADCLGPLLVRADAGGTGGRVRPDHRRDGRVHGVGQRRLGPRSPGRPVRVLPTRPGRAVPAPPGPDRDDHGGAPGGDPGLGRVGHDPPAAAGGGRRAVRFVPGLVALGVLLEQGRPRPAHHHGGAGRVGPARLGPGPRSSA